MHQGFINFFRLNSLNHIICWKCITSMFIWRNFLHCMKNIFFSLKFLLFFPVNFFFFIILGRIYRVLLHFTHWWDHFLVISQFFCQNLVQYHMIENFWCQTHHIFFWFFLCISWQVISNVKFFRLIILQILFVVVCESPFYVPSIFRQSMLQLREC